MSAGALPSPPSGIDPVDVKCRCADLWAHPLVRLLAGDAFRPGGLELTGQLVARLGLPDGAHVLDVGCGTGATLAHLGERRLASVGVDYSPTLVTEAASNAVVVQGDAEHLPFAESRFDAVLVECVLSALPDKRGALRSAHRVLRQGGRLGLSDVTLDGPVPEPLNGLLSWVACTAGALTVEGYVALLGDTGFRADEVSDHRPDLRALVAKARRRFALLAGAAGAGILDVVDPSLLPGVELVPAAEPDELLALGRELLAQLAAAVDAGQLGYIAVSASSV